MIATFVTEYAAADTAATAAHQALKTARKHVEPLSPELHALFLTKPEQYATCLRKMADIVETIPALTAAAQAADAALEPLIARRCFYCHGTGMYQAPTSHYTDGKPQCWKCHGTGENAASRKTRQKIGG